MQQKMSDDGQAQEGVLNDGLTSRPKPRRHPRKRSPSFHQKQIWFLTLFFGALMISLCIAFLWWLNASRWPGH